MESLERGGGELNALSDVDACLVKLDITNGLYIKCIYPKVGSASGQDEPYPSLWLASRVGKMVILSCVSVRKQAENKK